MPKCDFNKVAKQTVVSKSGKLFWHVILLNISIWLFSIANVEAVAQRCSVKKLFLETPQNLLENTCDRVSFLKKLQASGLQLF